MALKTYNPSDHIVVMCGIRVTGFAENMIKIEYNQDAVTLKVGAQGDAVRMISQDRSAKITVTLLASSPTNAQFSALLEADRPRDRSRGGGGGVAPSVIQDLNETVLAEATNTWIVKAPAMEAGKESGDLEWVFETDDLALALLGAEV